MKTSEWNEIRDQHENDIGNRLYLAPNAVAMKDTTDITKIRTQTYPNSLCQLSDEARKHNRGTVAARCRLCGFKFHELLCDADGVTE